MSAEITNHFNSILDGISGNLDPDANAFNFTKEEQGIWLAEMETTGEMLAAMLADRDRLEKERIEKEGKPLLPPTAIELKDLFDHIAQNHGYEGAQEVINLAKFGGSFEAIELKAEDELQIDESDLAA